VPVLLLRHETIDDNPEGHPQAAQRIMARIIASRVPRRPGCAVVGTSKRSDGRWPGRIARGLLRRALGVADK
jgi:hypothetical protein